MLINPEQTAKEIAQQRGLLRRIGGLTRNAKKVGLEGTLWSAPMIAYEVANAPKGYKFAEGLSSTISQLVVTPAFTSLAYIGLGLLFPEIGVGMLAVVASSLLAAPAVSFVETRLNRGFRAFRDIDKNTKKYNLGFQDSATAMSYRQNAMQELAGASGSSRRYLGREAMFLHR
jgi:hypothetical protein